VANKRLYTESDVAALPRGALLSLGKDALATPAALDMAYARGVQISYGDGKAIEGKIQARDDAFVRMLAQDGTYVVTVQKGGGTIVRLVDGVPTAFGSVASSPAKSN
jgi:hypothetical protein